MKLLLALFGILSLVALILYGVDKRRAVKGKWRIPESVLLSVGFFGGSVGALLGMYFFRHKTRHWYFWAVNWLGLVVMCVFLWLFGKNFSV
ncbi:MAG: DUF1294 domain-containing protein [Clostridia bacterium]|nr:DUF1294 domain-containing protein [Clostridia bacterium]MBR2926433.1 DUF1294 domain-containing protein [Clostridia bacterium]